MKSSGVGTWVVVVVALAATVTAGTLLVRLVPAALKPVSRADRVSGPGAPTRPGVLAVINASGIEVSRPLPTAAFALSGDQTLDARLPPGPFSLEMQVTFDPGAVRRASFGAEVEGGSFEVRKQGKPLDPARLAYLPDGLSTVVYRFECGAERPVRLRAMWQPQYAQVPLPLPAGGGEIAPEDLGLALVQQLNCVACHPSLRPDRQQLLAVSPAPLLGRVGARVRPGWIRQWLAGPSTVKPGAAMPALLDDGDGEVIEDLTHFLVSLGGPIDTQELEPDSSLVETGRVLYATIGCAACHHDLPMGPLAAKTTPGALAAFLADPVAVRPAGRMPAMRLTGLEADAIASYLIHQDRLASGTPVPADLDPDPERVRRGRDAFAARGCAACHALGGNGPLIASTMTAPALEDLRATEAGCLALKPAAGVPDFHLDAARRAAIVAYLSTLHQTRSGETPLAALTATLSRLDCLACHEFHGTGGVDEEVAAAFTVHGHVDLGDEGRLPPALDFAGARLTSSWMREILEESGVARPYMTARMPQFGSANVGHLQALFAAAAGAPAFPDDGPAVGDEAAELGRQLVGNRGFDCIQCHSIAGRASTNLPGPDLVRMPQRLRYEYFFRWLHDPKQIRPGTRMPTYFSQGRSGLDPFDGDAAQQIAAVWGYLSQGEFLPLPDGVAGAGGLAAFQLEVDDEPVVVRTFMTEAGARAIACGYPQRVHCAFDADRCRLALVWTGRFLNAAGAWAARGGTETDPDQPPAWTAPDRELFTTTDGRAMTARFLGYRLDDERRPVFRYELRSGSAAYDVSEQPIPHRGGEGEGGGPWMERRFEIRGPAGAALRVAGERDILLDGDGRAEFSLEVRW